ncbi:MAG TPA: ATP-binding protein, partial [Longilinea sp.]|nr:ATP-binding protein [Longilinea sp.]
FMDFVISLLGENFYIEFPTDLLGWVGLVLLIGAIVWLLKFMRNSFRPPTTKGWLLFSGLIAVLPFLNIFFCLRFPGLVGITEVGLSDSSTVPTLILFSALPWVIAAGFLEVVPAFILGLMSGIVLALAQTHSILTIPEISLICLVFTFFIRQGFRTKPFSFIRRPIGAALILTPFIVILHQFLFISVNAASTTQMDLTSGHSWWYSIALAIEVLIAGSIGEVLSRVFSRDWYKPKKLSPSPIENSLRTRFIMVIAPLLILIVAALLIGGWETASIASRQIATEQLSTAVQSIRSVIPTVMESGSSVIASQATMNLLNSDGTEIGDKLDRIVSEYGFFEEVILFNNQRMVIANRPLGTSASLTSSETSGLDVAAANVNLSTIITPAGINGIGFITFIQSIRDENNQLAGYLVGRTSVYSNPLTQGSLAVLAEFEDHEGIVYVLDGLMQTIYTSQGNPDGVVFSGNVPQGSDLDDQTGAIIEDGYLSYYAPLPELGWTIVSRLPSSEMNKIAIRISWPFFLIMGLVLGTSIFFMRDGLKGISRSLNKLSDETEKLSRGEFDKPIPVKSVDEVGQLAASFEGMRLSLKQRLEEMNQLLLVSQGAAAHLNLDEAIQPVLEAALHKNASSARVFLSGVEQEPGGVDNYTIGRGPKSEMNAVFDSQIFEVMRSHDILVIPDTSRSKQFKIPAGAVLPSALIAVAVINENEYYGVLWAAFDTHHDFSENEVSYFNTLASGVALSTSSARLYSTASVGRQRLEAVLASTPDPVLVFDEKQRLLLVNPAALQTIGLVKGPQAGRLAEDVIDCPELLDLLQQASNKQALSREITIHNDRIFFASVSPVNAEGRYAGQVCVLREVTHYKNLDKIKSDFVSTVSHDLRSPLTLMRGYATMLQMIGQVNEQQADYVRKIINSVDTMTSLVNNLLDLGRIEAGIGLQLEKLSPLQVVEHVVTSLQPQAGQRNIQLVKQIFVPAELEIHADPALLQQAIVNLVENAIKYSPMGSQVEINLSAKPNSVLFEVRDTGIGIAPLDLPRVFDKFFRSGRREAHQSRGTGLGLAIVKSIADQHHGRVWADSQLG